MLELKLTAQENEIDEIMRVKRAMLAEETFSVLYDIMAKLREIIKYENVDDKTYERFWKFREFVVDTMDSVGINMEHYYG